MEPAKVLLLKIISGVIKPTEGNIKIKGNVVPLLELASGFDPEYTGKENIYLKGALLGYSKSYLDEKYDEIVEFAELEDFIDVPLKNYSTGMSARLAFSIATVVNPKIMILDEVLSVGDAKFKEKSQERMKSLLNEDVTVLFVSHGLNDVRKICTDAIWLENGRLVTQGPVNEVCDKYEAMTNLDQKIIIISSDPSNYDIKVPVDKTIRVTFNENIQIGTNWIELKRSNGENIPITISISGKTLIVTPSVNLTKGKLYHLLLHTGCIKDLEDNPLSLCSVSFNTETG